MAVVLSSSVWALVAVGVTKAHAAIVGNPPVRPVADVLPGPPPCPGDTGAVGVRRSGVGGVTRGAVSRGSERRSFGVVLGILALVAAATVGWRPTRPEASRRRQPV